MLPGEKLTIPAKENLRQWLMSRRPTTNEESCISDGAPYDVYFVTYHATVLRIPVSKVSVGCQASSSCIRLASMA